MPKYSAGLVWFRRDLRDHDNAALHHALQQCSKVWCVFVFDTTILNALLERGLTADRRVEFIRASLIELDAALRQHGGGLMVLHAAAERAMTLLAEKLGVNAVYANRDYEPAAVARDQLVGQNLAKQGRALHLYKDQVIFEQSEIVSATGKPYSVFTPYRNAWLRTLTSTHSQPHGCQPAAAQLATPLVEHAHIPTLEQLGFRPTNLVQIGIPTGMRGASRLLDDFCHRIRHYGERRDYPAIKGPSYLSVHLRFGTMPIRALVRAALQYGAQESGSGPYTWLSELIWRDFYFQILHHHPHAAERAFKPDYDNIAWESGSHADALHSAWCEGKTGYPLVDAAMLQLNQSGYMHNRLRMVVASFFTKDLGIHWQCGEQYFADHLIDFDLAANNGGWQWAASSGCDAQPYFRIFNPVTQSEKFDPEGKFIKRYLPQLAKLSPKQIHAPWLLAPLEQKGLGIIIGHDYPAPVVAHDEARKRTLERYAVVKKGE